MKKIKILFAVLFVTLLSSCNNEQSLQKYYVENQEDSDFLAVDVPTSLFTNSESLEAEQKATLKTIKKINVLALSNDENKAKFEEEKAALNQIFKNEKYQLLMKYGGGNRKAELYFIGEEDAIDELIVYGYDDEQGLGVARVLGENMNPGEIMKLMRSLEEGDINVEGFKNVVGIFGDHHKDNDTVKMKKEESKDSIVKEE